MARSIPTYLSGIVEDLELERPSLVSLDEVREACARHGVRTEPRVAAARLKELGWLIPTPQKGVWEFAPAELAGAYSSHDPLMPAKAFAKANPTCSWALAGQAAAWALGLADRAPSVIEVAFTERPRVKVPDGIHAIVFEPIAPRRNAKGASVLAPESIVVAMCAKPASVRTWLGANEWLPDVAYEADAGAFLEELACRPASVAIRAGYLLQGMRPDIASEISGRWEPATEVRFGRGRARRRDGAWRVSDSILPFDPREMERVR